MSFIAFILISFTPGLFWLWFYIRKDVYRPAPKRLIVLTFFLGCLSTIPAGIIEFFALSDFDRQEISSLSSVAMSMLLVVGPVEELSKFGAVRLFAYRSLYFEEPIDGLVYGAAASLGFASLENLLYVYSYGPSVMIVRAPVSTLAHLIFGSAWGYALGLHMQSGRTRSKMIVLGIGAAAVLHGMFNLMLFAFPLASLAIVILGSIWAYKRFNWGQLISPFRYRRNLPRVECAECKSLIRSNSRFCPFCGSRHLIRKGSIFCGNCESPNRSDAIFCTNCGDQFVN